MTILKIYDQELKFKHEDSLLEAEMAADYFVIHYFKAKESKPHLLSICEEDNDLMIFAHEKVENNLWLYFESALSKTFKLFMSDDLYELLEIAKKETGKNLSLYIDSNHLEIY